LIASSCLFQTKLSVINIPLTSLLNISACFINFSLICSTLNYTILNFEKDTFQAVISLSDFLLYARDFKGEGKNSDLQKILPLHYWNRVYLNSLTPTLRMELKNNE